MNNKDDKDFHNVGEPQPIGKTIKVPVEEKVGSNDEKAKFELIQGHDSPPKIAHVPHLGYLTDETNPQLQALGKAIRIRNTSKEIKTLLEIIYKAANMLETRGHFTEADEIRSAALKAVEK
jgi:hypothetical protein